MTIDSLLSELNEHQRAAASMQRQHALVLAGAGTGKTKTIIARAAFLIANGTPSQRIQILTFTRRSASEIVERVSMHLGDAAAGLKASTFHTWCMSLIRRAPSAFGCKGYSVIDRDDQLLLFKVLRGKNNSLHFPTALTILELYSFARNTGQTLDATLQKNAPESYGQKDRIGQIMLGYEARKTERRYLDYDDILDVVAQRLASSPETYSWVASHYDHILVDEMQDTNPLQWKLIDPLKNQVTLFCVGDDAQSIYGFRGADFRNVHSFGDRVDGSVTLKLEQNYRSTQEILDVSNWLLSESPLNYGKNLVAMHGYGKRPQLHTFADEWQEGRWVGDDLLERRRAGANWRQHMILVRSKYAGRAIEIALLAKEIPYIFIGGFTLLESAHVRDLLSVLRVVANPKDEIGWMRFLTLWKGVGEVTANRVIERILVEQTLDGCIQAMKGEVKVPEAATKVVHIVRDLQNDVSKAVSNAVRAMEDVLSAKYQNQEWDKRRRDFRLVEKLAEKHSSILAFIEEYLLDPVYVGLHDRPEDKDVVTLSTIHAAKGTEREVCYVVNVSPGAFPLAYAESKDEVEEERRVLYVALTRAKDELIVTRHSYVLWAESRQQNTVPNTSNVSKLGANPNTTDVRKLRAQWNDVLAAVRPQCGPKQQAALRAVRDIAIGENAIALSFGNNKFARDVISEGETLTLVSTILAQFIGRQVAVECQEGEVAILSAAAGRVVWDDHKADDPDPLLEFTVALPDAKADDQSNRVESYFLNALPDGLFDEHIHKREDQVPLTNAPQITQPVKVGIVIG